MGTAYFKDILRTIGAGKKRFLSIVIVTLLGVTMFSGLQASCNDLRHSADLFFDTQRLHDLEIVSTLGLTDEDVEALAALPETEEVRGRYAQTVSATFSENVMDISLEVLYDDPLDRPYIVEGRAPEQKHEVMVSQRFTRDTGASVGDTFTIEEDVDDDEDPVYLVTEYTITGVFTDVRDVNNPRGATAFRGGMNITPLALILPEAADNEIYTSVVLTVDGVRELFCFDAEYTNRVRAFREYLETHIKEGREKARYESLVTDARQELADAEKEAEEELADALSELQDGERELQEELDDAMKELTDAEKEIADGEKKLADAKKELTDAEQELAEKEQEAEDEFAKAHEELDGTWVLLLENETELDKKAAEIDEGAQAISDAEAQIDAREATTRADIAEKRALADYLESQGDTATAAQIRAACDAGEQTLNAELAAARAQLTAQRNALEEGRMQIDNARKKIEEGWQEYADGVAKLKEEEEKARAEIADAHAEIDKARAEIADNERKLADAKRELQEGYDEYEKGKREGEDKLREGYEEYEEGKQEAEEKIEEARQKIDDIDMATWYVRDRLNLSAYSNIDSDSDAIESVGTVFPVVFFLVAILISLTAVTRMIEEDRGLIGAYKALGFNDAQIRRKYLVFTSGAALSGAALGTIAAFIGLPLFLFTIFDIMYILPGYRPFFLMPYGILGPLIFTLGVVGAAYLSSTNAMKETPASLMRPKSPKAGSRVLLEKVTMIWSRLSFLNKVTARNLFRYKKRMLMTVFGIAGCMALLLFGFAIRDSVQDLMPRQYEQTTRYDLLAIATTGEEEEGKTLSYYLTHDEEIDSYLEAYITTVRMQNKDGREQTVQLTVLDDDDDPAKYIDLRDTKGRPLTLKDGDVYVSRTATRMLSLSAGDVFVMQLPDLETAELTLTQVAQNYLGNVMYMTRATFESYFDAAEDNGAMILLKDSIAPDDPYREEFGGREGILTCLSTAQVKEQFSQTFLLMDAVVMIVIAMSAALAFAVLFTLSTTNISERERELATIKVLGFYDREVHLYVDKETLILSGIGILIGVPLGRLFAETLPLILKIPAMYMAVSLHPVSYLYAAGLTVVFALLVNVITDRILNRIDMVEALKSVE